MTNVINIYVGRKLREARRSRYYKLTDIAELLNMTRQQCSKYETGQNKINVENLWKIAQFYQMGVDEFLPIPSWILVGKDK